MLYLAASTALSALAALRAAAHDAAAVFAALGMVGGARLAAVCSCGRRAVSFSLQFVSPALG